MTVRVLLFAELAERVGKELLTLELADGATVADALRELGARHEAIRARSSAVAVAVDERYCGPDEPLADGQTMALIPPVSGG